MLYRDQMSPVAAMAIGKQKRSFHELEIEVYRIAEDKTGSLEDV